MTPLAEETRKNPVLPTRQPMVPPTERSRVALGLTAAAAQGRLALQVCKACGAVQYPPREACHDCLGENLEWRDQDGRGTLLAATTIRRPYELYHRANLTWSTGLVRLECGVTVVAFLHGSCPAAPAQVRIHARLDRGANAVLIAVPEKEIDDMNDDPLMRRLGCSVKGRKVLVTDATSPVGQELVRAVIAGGAEIVWVGFSEPWRAHHGFEQIRQIPQVTALPLDLTDVKSVQNLAGQIGGRVDILINSAEFHRTGAPMPRLRIDVARAEMETNYFGLLRLAQAFAPAMSSRAADGVNNAVAWVNILSIFALSNYAPHNTFSASKAAAYSISQSLRADLRSSGLRVLNVFPGPVDEDWNQLELPPKITPRKLASLIVEALETGIEDLYPDPIARDWHARWRSDPKVLELELSQ